MSSARIARRLETTLSPWVRLIAKEVEREPGGPTETYHCLGQADYITIVARLPDGRIPIVRQFRAAVEQETWELPAGMLEAGEEPEAACRRELLEETGAVAGAVRDLGAFWPDTGRLENRLRVFAVEATPPAADFQPEPGVAASLVSPARLREMILAGQFVHQLHIGALAVASLRGFELGVLR
jgi:ADP-ribose pyrophosphatase